jgi:hypothetical protein
MFKRKIYFLLLGLILLVGVFAASPFIGTKKAYATPGMFPFGGYILYTDPGFTPPAICVPHVVIFDIVTHSVIGIFPSGMIFSYYNFYTPSVAVLGEYVPFPIQPCARPYGVFPLYQVGTGAF